MIDLDAEEVKRQLNRLVEEMPDDDVDIWVKVERRNYPKPHRALCYTIYVRGRDGLPSETETGDVLPEAVDRLLKAAGPRNGESRVRAKREAIEKARAELAKLESELDPLVMAMDKAQAEIETKPTP